MDQSILDSMQRLKRLTDIYSAPIDLQRQLESLNPLRNLMENSAIARLQNMAMPWANNTVFKSFEVGGLVDIAQRYNKQFESFNNLMDLAGNAIKINSIASFTNGSSAIDLLAKLDSSSKSTDFYNILSAKAFRSIIQEYPDIENFEVEENIFERISQDPILNEAQALLFHNAANNTITEQDVPSILQFVNFVGDRFNLGKKERVVIFSLFSIIITLLIGVGVNKISDILPPLKGDQSVVETKPIPQNNSITFASVDSIVKALNIDLIISRTYLYEKNSIRSKHIDSLSAQTEIRIIDYKENWCYVEVMGKPEIKGWVMNKKIERFQ